MASHAELAFECSMLYDGNSQCWTHDGKNLLDNLT